MSDESRGGKSDSPSTEMFAGVTDDVRAEQAGADRSPQAAADIEKLERDGYANVTAAA